MSLKVFGEIKFCSWWNIFNSSLLLRREWDDDKESDLHNFNKMLKRRKNLIQFKFIVICDERKVEFLTVKSKKSPPDITFQNFKLRYKNFIPFFKP